MGMAIQVDRNFTQFVVFAEDTILFALSKITANQSRLIFVVSENGILQGVLTDGDFRRWIASCGEIDLNKPVTSAMNATCQSAAEGTSASELAVLLNSRIVALPLLDSHGRIVAVARKATDELKIGKHKIGDQSPCFLIAEIGNNHNGDVDKAIKLIDAAYEAGADCAKFQMRDMNRLYRNAGKSNDMSSDLGTQYTLDLLERFQLADEDLYKCFDHAAKRGLIPLCTPWDQASLEKLNHWGMEGFKVASADFTNHEHLSSLAATGKPLICSTGMASELEIRSGIRHLQNQGASYVLLHCNSTYPTPFKDVNLRYIERLRDLSGAPVGYSGHERGIEIPIAAAALGAVVIEKHITLDRCMEGNDHKVSLLPDEFSQMVKGIRRVEESMGSSGERSISQGEMMNREILAKSLVATCDIATDTEITKEMVGIQSPGQGLQPNRLDELLGRRLAVQKKVGDYFFPSDLETTAAKPRPYTFRHRFGLPVRYHDIATFTSTSNLDLVEIHLSYKDLEIDIRNVLQEKQKIGLVVHAPELFAGDHTLDLCSHDETYRKHSIRELQKVINICRDLREYFTCPDKVLLVTNVGGFSEHRHLELEEIKQVKERLMESLEKIETTAEVEIIPQTMPPFPWHFGGRYHNLFVDSGFKRFLHANRMRVCLDVSHSKLACSHLNASFSAFLNPTLHGTLTSGRCQRSRWKDYRSTTERSTGLVLLMRKFSPRTNIPEIWQGHKNNEEGAWLALERLETCDKQAQYLETMVK